MISLLISHTPLYTAIQATFNKSLGHNSSGYHTLAPGSDYKVQLSQMFAGIGVKSETSSKICQHQTEIHNRKRRLQICKHLDRQSTDY